MSQVAVCSEGHCRTRQNSLSKHKSNETTWTLNEMPQNFITWNIAHASFLTLLMGKKADDGLQSAEGSVMLKSNLGQFYLSFERSSP